MSTETPNPPELEPMGAPTTIVRTGGSGRLRWAAAFVALVAIVVGAVVVVASSDDDVDPDEALAAAQELVEEAESYRFQLRQTSHQVTGEEGGSGSETTTRTVTNGAVAGEDRWSLSYPANSDPYMEGMTASETRRVGEVVYSTGGDDEDLPAVGPAWYRRPAGAYSMTVDDFAEELESFEDEAYGDGFDDQYRASLVLSAYMLPIDDDPSNLERVIAASEEPAVEEDLADGGVRLRTTLPPIPELEEASSDPLPPVEVLLDLDAERRPTLAKFEVAIARASEILEITFEDWGDEVVIDAPSDGEIDQTPWIEEELLRELDPRLLLLPTALPDGMQLTNVYVFDNGDEDLCPQLELGYGSEGDAEFFAGRDEEDISDEEYEAYYAALRYLSVSVYDPACMGDFADATPFEEQIAGLPARNVDSEYVEVQVDGVVVVVSGQFDDAARDALVRSLRLTTVDDIAASIPAWATSDEHLYGDGTGAFFQM